MKSRKEMVKILFDLYCKYYKEMMSAKTPSGHDYYSGKANGIAEVLYELFKVQITYDGLKQMNVLIDMHLDEEEML